MNTEKQFGIFENNLEKFDSDLKNAFSRCLNDYDKEKLKNPEHKIDEWFLVKIITELKKEGKINFDGSENDRDKIYSDLKIKVEEMLSVCGIEHSFNGNLKSGLDIPGKE